MVHYTGIKNYLFKVQIFMCMCMLFICLIGKTELKDTTMTGDTGTCVI